MQDLFRWFVIQFVQVCRNWRYTLFHPSFWKKITFVFRDEDSVLWTRFVESYLSFIYKFIKSCTLHDIFCYRTLANYFALSVHEATIRWDQPRHIDYVGETYKLLKQLSHNKQLRKLFLEFNSNVYDLSIDNEDDRY